MSNTWQRLIFWGALSVPLVHGCGASDVQCLGTPVACANRDATQCISGCSIREGCFGGPVSCETLTDRAELCIQTEGCQFLGSCEGEPGCAALGFSDECEATPGCNIVRVCAGAGLDCSGLEDSQCELYAQCELGIECVGTPRSCGDVGSVEQCVAVPGCSPADTRPSVLD